MANRYADLSYEPAIAYFVNRVRQVSRGLVRIDVESDWGRREHTAAGIRADESVPRTRPAESESPVPLHDGTLE